MPTDKSLTYTADLVKRYDRDRFLTALFAPADGRERLLTLYAFNVEIARIRETVTEPIIGQMRLQWWRDVLNAISEGEGPPKGHPVAEPLADLIESHSLPLDPFMAVLEVREQDLSEDPPSKLNDLVALGVSDDQSLRTAEDIATAWSLIGVSRAARFQALAGRGVLPRESMEKQGLAIQDLQNPESAQSSAIVISEVCDAARDHLAAARQKRNTVDLTGLPVFLLATLADSYLNGLKRAKYQIHDLRVIRQRPAVARLWWNNWRKRF